GPAAGAAVRARLEDVVVLAAERRLRTLLAQHLVLLGRQLLPPLLLGLLDLRHEPSVAGRGAPNGIRTRATALKGPRPGPLVDGGGAAQSRGTAGHGPAAAGALCLSRTGPN